MATGRTVSRWARMYANGYDISGSVEQVGPLAQVFDFAEYTALNAEVKGVLPNQASIGIGSANCIFDTSTSPDDHEGIHTIEVAKSWAGSALDVMIPVGIRAAPAAGDPCFCGKFVLAEYLGVPSGNKVVSNLKFADWDVSDLVNYTKPWGTLLHANGAATGANTQAGIDDRLAASAYGGYMAYQVFAASGGANTFVIKVQNASTNTDGSFGDLSVATTGSLAASSAPCAGIVAIGNTATVLRYLRWQLDLTGGATSVTFALAFVRG